MIEYSHQQEVDELQNNNTTKKVICQDKERKGMARTEITNAIRKFGEMSHNIQINTRGDVAIVYVDHEYFGIWDFGRHTFVD